MRRLLLTLAVFVSACAPAMIPAPVVTTPKFPDFVTPAVPLEFANTAAAINQTRGWAFLRSGDVKTAEHEFMAALKNDARFYPAETSLGYVELARKDAKAALARFDTALERRHDQVSALFGRGQAMLALNRESDALAAFESVLVVDPAQIEARRRVDVLQFRVLEQEIARARDAARAGRLDEAAEAYGTALVSQPDSPFLYRELAGVERQQDRIDAALEHLRRAVALDPGDARSLTQIGVLLEGQNDLAGAEKAYSEAAAIEPSRDLETRLAGLRARAALDKLPDEYRAIEQAPQVTRADLAALIGIRLAPLLRDTHSSDAALITDARTSWAQSWIMEVARAGVMEPFANHAFQPRTIVRRSDLASAAARLLARIGTDHPAAARAWESSRPRFSDVAPDHLAYPAAAVAVAAGVMHTEPDQSFQPSRPVTGAEAVEAISKLESLAGLK